MNDDDLQLDTKEELGPFVLWVTSILLLVLGIIQAPHFVTLSITSLGAYLSAKGLRGYVRSRK